ncbi:MazG-like family protein [Streptomyces sp. NPDC005805]|uniref:MazG-like family protein n=1 Tax=Streptomyces sp. NPDC005805 TaxID=3157068 RepID=UPI0033D727A5
MDASAWADVRRLVEWLDAEAVPVPGETARLLRVIKIGEEFGEVVEAVHGAMGANPRKGASHSWEDVHSELCDVIVTAMVALASLTPDAPGVLEARLRELVARTGAPPAAR